MTSGLSALYAGCYLFAKHGQGVCRELIASTQRSVFLCFSPPLPFFHQRQRLFVAYSRALVASRIVHFYLHLHSTSNSNGARRLYLQCGARCGRVPALCNVPRSSRAKLDEASAREATRAQRKLSSAHCRASRHLLAALFRSVASAGQGHQPPTAPMPTYCRPRPIRRLHLPLCSRRMHLQDSSHQIDARSPRSSRQEGQAAL